MANSSSTGEGFVTTLLSRWEESAGTLTPEQLCAECPHLIDTLRRRIESLLRADQTLGDRVPHAGVEPLAGYRLVEILGEGGFGQVWRVSSPDGMRAAKFVKLTRTAGESELKGLQSVGKLRHPNLVAMYRAKKWGNWLLVVMELGDGTLEDRLNKCAHGIPREELLGYMEDAARGIDFLNKNKVIHRDIKPQNLLLFGNRVKVADFGLAKMIEQTVVTHSGTKTPAFAAPEFFSGKTYAASDQYCLAVTYCYLRTKKLPFEGDAMQILAGHLQGQPNLDLMNNEERIAVNRALSKQPDQRWPSCVEFVNALRRSTSSLAICDVMNGTELERSTHALAGKERSVTNPPDTVPTQTTSPKEKHTRVSSKTKRGNSKQAQKGSGALGNCNSVDKSDKEPVFTLGHTPAEMREVFGASTATRLAVGSLTALFAVAVILTCMHFANTEQGRSRGPAVRPAKEKSSQSTTVPYDHRPSAAER